MKSLGLYLLSTIFAYVYTHEVGYSQQISSDDSYKFNWWIDDENQTIRFELDVKTEGWAAMGINSIGKMLYADMYMTYIKKDGTAVVLDRYGKGTFEPLDDSALGGKSDTTVVSNSLANGRTKVSFSRKFDTGDYFDEKIIKGKMYFMLFSYRTQGNPEKEGSFQVHTGFYVKQIVLYPTTGQETNVKPLKDKYVAPEFKSMDLIFNNFPVKATATDYACKFFKVNKMLNDVAGTVGVNKTYHAVAFEPIIGNGPYVHHFILYNCILERMTEAVTDNFTTCKGPPTGCEENAVLWGTGGNPYELPSNVGMVWGTFSSYVTVLQIHYNNPTEVKDQYDSSGFRVYYTDKLRQYDMGVSAIGAATPFFANDIPALTKSTVISLGCPTACINKSITSEMNVVSFILHGHELLKKIKMIVTFPNGTIDSTTFATDNYDYNHQYMVELKSPYVIPKNSSFLLQCDFDSSKKSALTKFGLGGTDEMCLNFVNYYPKESGPMFCNVNMDVPLANRTQTSYCVPNYAIPRPTTASSHLELGVLLLSLLAVLLF